MRGSYHLFLNPDASGHHGKSVLAFDSDALLQVQQLMHDAVGVTDIQGVMEWKAPSRKYPSLGFSST
jgi:hypothetical protein